MERSFYLDEYNDFLAIWGEAVKAYGTPLTLVLGSEIKSLEQTFYGETHPFVYQDTPGYARRAELMAQEKKEAEGRKAMGEEPRWTNDGSSCFLCDNIGQAEEAQRNSKIPNNLIYDRGSYFVLPNKYPAFVGHSLFIIKSHDDESFRVKPLEVTIEEKKYKEYRPEEGRTRGNVITPDFLEALVKSCEEYNLVGIRNHALDGMSISGHDHFQVFPTNLKMFSLVPRLVSEMQETEYGEEICRARNTPFDMLVVNSSIKDFYEKASSFLEKMETGNEVFTLLYTGNLNGKGKLIVSPRRNSSEIIIPNFNKVGGGMTFHSLEKTDEAYFKTIETWVPGRGEFDWGKYF